MTAVPSKRKRFSLIRVLIPLVVLGLPILTWLLVPNPLVRGFVTGFTIGPTIIVAAFVVFARRMRTRLEARLSPPPLPHGKWDFTMSATTLDGRSVEFSSFSGQVLVLNFWATWCSPCVAEMPGLARLREATSDVSVEMACVTQEPGEVVRKFVKKHPLDVPLYLLSGDPPEQFKSRAIPATFVLDKAGMIVLQHRGAAAWDDPTIVNFVRGLAVAPQ